MLYETQIGKLSKQRINNLLKGKSVRIKSGTSHTVYLTEQQLNDLLIILTTNADKIKEHICWNAF